MLDRILSFYSRYVKRGKKNGESHSKAHLSFERVKVTVLPFLSHNDYLAQSVPNYIRVCVCMYVRIIIIYNICVTYNVYVVHTYIRIR